MKQKFKKFYLNQMTSEENQDFRSNLENSSTLKASFEEYVLLQESFDELIRIDAKKTLKSLKSSNVSLRFLKSIAAIGIILAFSLIGLKYHAYNVQANLFDTYYFEPSDYAVRGEAIQNLSLDQKIYLAGHQALTGRNLPLAIEKFSQLIDQQSEYTDQAEWYLILAYIKKEDFSAAQKIVTAISIDPDHIYHSESIKLLKDLENN